MDDRAPFGVLLRPPFDLQSELVVQERPAKGATTRPDWRYIAPNYSYTCIGGNEDFTSSRRVTP